MDDFVSGRPPPSLRDVIPAPAGIQYAVLRMRDGLPDDAVKGACSASKWIED
jgi:hypothetical protein